MKLHLGCGDKHLDGFVNIDIRFLAGVDKIDNIRFLRRYSTNSIEEIYACHVLEHFSRWEYESVLRRWFDILLPGGLVKIAVPDFESIVKQYSRGTQLKDLMGLLYGGQDYEENFHYVVWDFDTLNKDLAKIGFEKIERYDWRDTSHHKVDDFSQCYLPHMNKDSGTLMSLNVKAYKPLN